MGVCTRESNLVDAIKNYEAEKCPYKKTNADLIRTMTDEELAELFVEVRIGMVTSILKTIAIPWEQPEGLKELTVKEELEWLQEPVEGDERCDGQGSESDH
jgi:hypothetical protein